MDYTKKMEISEILLELATMRTDLLDVVSTIEKVAKNIAVLAKEGENRPVIVRCKDCDNTVPHWYMLNDKRVDCNWCVEMESEVDDDEYCSRAVPKGTRAKMKGGAE